jgi:hypothetical protein
MYQRKDGTLVGGMRETCLIASTTQPLLAFYSMQLIIVLTIDLSPILLRPSIIK